MRKILFVLMLVSMLFISSCDGIEPVEREAVEQGGYEWFITSGVDKFEFAKDGENIALRVIRRHPESWQYFWLKYENDEVSFSDTYEFYDSYPCTETGILTFECNIAGADFTVTLKNIIAPPPRDDVIGIKGGSIG